MTASVQSTKFLNSKGRRIFISARGVPFAKTADGKRVYRVKAISVSNNNGNRKLRPNNVRALPSAIRPARALTKTNVPVKKSPATKMANTMFRAAVRNAKKQDNESKATLKAHRDESKGMRKKAGKRPYVDRGMHIRKVRKNKGVARKTNSQWAANMFNRLVNHPARKTRKNKGVERNLIASPGGTVYKGMAALTRQLKKLNKNI